MRSACFLSLARWASPLLLTFVAACATDKDPMEKQLKKMQDDLTRLQSETDRMGERLDAMETRQASASRYADDRVAAAGPTTTLARPKLKVVRVEPGSDLYGDAADGDQAGTEADNGPRVLIQGEGKSLETRTLPAAAKTAPAPAAKTPKADKPEGTKASKSEAAPAK